eukprot:1177957-Prorocentrum_minimum.AAC.2
MRERPAILVHRGGGSTVAGKTFGHFFCREACRLCARLRSKRHNGGPLRAGRGAANALHTKVHTTTQTRIPEPHHCLYSLATAAAAAAEVGGIQRRALKRTVSARACQLVGVAALVAGGLERIQTERSGRCDDRPLSRA